MKNKLSLLACIVISFIYTGHRFYYADIGQGEPLKVTDWDALGYYLYLPSTLIYHDYKRLDWFPAIDSEYHVSGGEFYQALKHENGNYFYKYLGGVAIMQLPFFLTAHLYASNSAHYQADGFSPPYQYAIALGNLVYFIIALFLLRSFLLLYFKDETVMVSLLLMTLATNLIQYIAVNGGMSHGYIFPLYVFILWATYNWHESPRFLWAAAIGYIIGLGTISRPTEAVMLFIPLLWNTQNKETATKKWDMVREHIPHVIIAILSGLLAIVPQLLYWRSVTGSFVYDVGSKWSFLNPFFRVLFGWEKGWFIYTPVTVFFIAGLFFVKKYPFKNAVIWFCILNIYIIISWFDWRYGGSYSTRALTQSYPVFSLSLAAFVHYLQGKKWKGIFYTLGIYLIAVNLFQVYQYNNTILHFNDMNRNYYSVIYLKAHPSPLDMSLLDTDDFLSDENAYSPAVLIQDTFKKEITPFNPVADTLISLRSADWIKVRVKLKIISGIWNSKIKASLGEDAHFFRLENAISKEGVENEYEFYLKPKAAGLQKLVITVESSSGMTGRQHLLYVVQLQTAQPEL
ncbi:MAG TPA: hypothetical protein VL098_11510 [Flavipsychrobacter sp.]|nr:hypothetical protein [Flavipsychrobacter sp.]